MNSELIAAAGPGAGSATVGAPWAWTARLTVVVLAASMLLVLPPLGSPGADAAPTSSGVVELGGLDVEHVVERAADAAGDGVARAQTFGPETADDPEAATEGERRWLEVAPIEAGASVMVGIEVAGGQQPDAQIRTRTGDEWIAWEELEYPDEEDGPDPGTAEEAGARNATEPLWVGEVDEIQVRVADTDVDLEDVRLHTVDIDGDLDFDPLAAEPGAAHASSTPDIISRSSWDPRGDCAPRRSPSVASNANFTVIHHTAGSNNYTESQAVSQLRAICLYHRNSLGWNDIGYNIVVDRYGRTYEGRAGGLHRAVVGAHAAGYNAGSFGVAVMGCFDTGCSSSLGGTALPSAALRAVDRAVAWKFAIHGIDPYGRHTHSNGHRIDTIVGHRDVGQTSCPGNRFTPYVRGSFPMKDRVAPLLAQFSPWPKGQAGDFSNGSGGGIATFDDSTGDMMVAQSNGGSFDVGSWTRFRTRDGWRNHLVADVTRNGRDDVISYHPATGNWWVSRSNGDSFTPELWNTFQSRTGWRAHLTGDFTGDGRQDIASFHRNGTWWVSASNGSSFTTTKWGEYRTSDGWQTHLVGDVTGNGRDDILSYHPGTGRWFLLRSEASGLLGLHGSQFTYERYTTFRTRTGWGPHLVGDFTGNGLADTASYHRGNGAWWVIRASVTGPRQELWAQFRTRTGWQTHLAGDLTGNGRDDIASFHPGSGNWWVSASNGRGFEGSRWMQFGTTSGWKNHVLVDVDGDGRQDVASYNGPLNGWWVSHSQGDGFRTTRWW